MRAKDPTRRSGGVVAIVAVPIALIALALGVQIAGAMAQSAKPGPIKVTSDQNHPIGIPAITPRAGMAVAAGATGPHFTRADVIQYITAHPEITGAVSGKPAPTVTSVRFVTAKQASALLQGESIGLPDSAPVCVVQLRGTFASSFAPPGFNAPATTDTAILVFDGQTGNLLIS